MEHKIEEWSSSLTYRLMEIKLVDVAEMKRTIKTHIKSALYDCLKCQISETEQELIKLKSELSKSKKDVFQVGCKIAILNQKLKAENKAFANLERENQAKELVLWMRKFHNESILEFYKMYNYKFPKL